MPKAKRVKVVELTKTKSKKKDGRKQIMASVNDAVAEYDYVWVFSVENMRNQYLKKVRKSMDTSRFFFGSNKVMARALGNTPEEELKDNLHKISESLVGDVGLVFTNLQVEEAKKAFDSFQEDDYARAGNVAAYQVVIPAGEVVRGYSQDKFPNNMEPQLRELGMPTRLKQGKITIDSDYVICNKGDKLTPQQANLLKHFWEKMAIFKVQLVAYWHKSGEFVKLQNNEDSAEEISSPEVSDEEMD
ncbi:60S acidic ribosomal protein PO [Coemansia reversa NRRL 1564]|uniref:Ribosome assembly factor mrt4 n=1 Tax=Coemansia reversa (strain ATCC 12441 / NRRL 1564) TaxID=763665 RepID=A0A2G5BKT7_COERN|nr:60S acidic ribosomal protein PO [Coemansia reversa NRRL 1564]|eukprot:PIA19601.1 60S acidic ribosomal protein PO [Coemansia reversa NRRL 1564]